ncbi:ABC transporter ATP-binding protein [Phycicoccus sp. Root101]|uniref:ABC transporter ATP-binding protein n=1 Tax=Phycicoccus sp. Root101 TaxID=1736421 RepID=UPI000703A1D9|nr:ABC transporter ATP-binding protein [Phycicoccus sp. Root101]KQU69507.1 ABC transporter ATP-binding protein [Phycicoccus sp. Root101]
MTERHSWEPDEELETPPLVVDTVTVRYGDTVAVDAASFDAYAGEFIAVTGHSGAGKSSLLWAIAGAVPAEGGVRLGDDLVTDRSQGASLGIEVIPQGSALAVLLTAQENLELPLLARGVSAEHTRHRVQAALAAVGLEESGSHLAEELSGGQQQRVAVARGLALRGRVLLADEPTSELDHDNREKVLALLRAEAERGAIVVMATHDPEAAAQADGEIRLDDGHLETVRVPRS